MSCTTLFSPSIIILLVLSLIHRLLVLFTSPFAIQFTPPPVTLLIRVLVPMYLVLHLKGNYFLAIFSGLIQRMNEVSNVVL
jgi:hypothetical protein